jgi:hypothetical protein
LMADVQHSVIFTTTVHVEGITCLPSKRLLQLSLGQTLKIWTSVYTHSMQTTGKGSAHTCWCSTSHTQKFIKYYSTVQRPSKIKS